MSLDTVELVMEMEEAFGIVIDDLDAEKIGTVGQAYRYILSRVELRTASPCPGAALFYRIRRGLMARSGADRRAIRPTSRIADFLPEAGRREAWLDLGGELGVNLPRLTLSTDQAFLAMDIGLACGGSLLVAMLAVTGGMPGDPGPWLALSGLAFVLGWLAAVRSLNSHASTIPRGSETLRGTVLATLGRATPRAEGVPKTWHPDEVWATLRDLISEQLGISPGEIAEEKHFVHDLGMD